MIFWVFSSKVFDYLPIRKTRYSGNRSIMQHAFPPLKSACFLRKEMRYYTEIVLEKEEKTQALNTSLLNLPQIDILGTHLFVSEREKNFKIPYLVEMAEVDDGHMVVVNLQRALNFLITKLMQEDILDIHDLSMHKAAHLPPVICANDLKFDVITKKFQPHLLVIHPIVQCDSNKNAFFPQIRESWVFDHLIDAISYRRGGQRATLIFYALNTGIEAIVPNIQSQDDYSKILIEALKSGVELITAKIDVKNNSLLTLSFDNIFSQEGI
ncbi:hypothetical protein EBR43_02640 [bacterium]|nr:hypothetical protein [bacterium]NBX72173.1 hypothetical protein [bacterium]